MLKTNFSSCKPCSAFTIPSSFAKCITYMDQIWYLYNHKQNTLTAGSNIILTDNEDGTTTISSSGEIKGEKFLIKAITPPEHYVAGYELVTESGEKAGVDILIPDQTFDPTNIEAEIAALQNSLNSVNTTVATLQTDMTTAKADITGLKQSVRNIGTNIEHLYDDKQNKLTAGTNISINDNVISSTYAYDDSAVLTHISEIETETTENGEAIQANTNSIEAINTSISSINSTLPNKQEKLTAGTNISINDNVISSTYAYDDSAILTHISELETETTENSKSIQANTNSIEAINTSISSINSSLTNKQEKLTAGTGLQILKNVIGFTDNPPVGQITAYNITFNNAAAYDNVDMAKRLTIKSQEGYITRQITLHVFNADKSAIIKQVKFTGTGEITLTNNGDFIPRSNYSNSYNHQFELQMNIDIPASEAGFCGIGYVLIDNNPIFGFLQTHRNTRNIYFTAFDPSQFTTIASGTTFKIFLFLG